MNLLAIIIILLALITAGSIVYIAWELSSGRPVFKKRGSDIADAGDNTAEPGKGAGADKQRPE